MRSTKGFTDFLTNMGVDTSFTMKRCSIYDTYFNRYGNGFGVPRHYYHVHFKNGKPKRMRKGA